MNCINKKASVSKSHRSNNLYIAHRTRKESGQKSSRIEEQPISIDKALLLRNCETKEETSDRLHLPSELKDNTRSFSPTTCLGVQSITLYRQR